MSADLITDAADKTDIEIGEALQALRSGRVSRIRQADHTIPMLYADIKAAEERIEEYRKDREWCLESIRTLDRRLADMEE